MEVLTEHHDELLTRSNAIITDKQDPTIRIG